MSATDRRNRGRAFTLIELVAVIVLVAILAASVGGPILSSLGSIRTRHAAARLAGDLAYLQRIALNTRRRTWAVIDVAGNRVRYYVEDAANPGKANRQPLVHEATGSSDAVQFGAGEFRGAALSSCSIAGTGELEFDSFGAPYDGNETALVADGTIAFNGGVTLTIRAVSGLVEVSG